MKLPTLRSSFPRAAAGLAVVLLILVSGLGACGGGVGSGGTGGFAAGPITGFGSVIVNDVRFDDSAAQVLDGDGVARTRDDLRLGMTVEIDSSAITTGASGAVATASRIRYDSELLGAVASVDSAGGTFTLLGQRVVVDAATVFAESVGGLAALKAGAMVEVFAVYDPATVNYRATRVAAAGSNVSAHLRGPVAQADAAAQTLRIGNATYGYAGVAAPATGVTPGQFVRLRVAAGVPPSGPWPVLSFGTALQPLPDRDGATLKGLVSAYTSTRSFSVNGRAVDAGTANFPNGSAGLAVGARVEVAGALRNGILVASRVTVSSAEQDNAHEFELHGAITAVNPAQQTFVLRGQLIGTARPELRYQNGGAANLVVGRSVAVKGRLSADGLRVEATSIDFQ